MKSKRLGLVDLLGCLENLEQNQEEPKTHALGAFASSTLSRNLAKSLALP